jgi:hypothetical protein
MSLGTRWGLICHYWVLFSLVLTVFATAVLLIETRTIRACAAVAGDPTAPLDALRSLPRTLVHSIGGLVVPVVVLVLNVYRPQGMARYGRRRQQERRPAPV